LSEKLSAYKVDVICVVDEEVNKKSFADVFTQDNPFEQKWFFLVVPTDRKIYCVPSPRMFQ
jgi:uncharacterized protein YrzB (UPF0473 family)